MTDSISLLSQPGGFETDSEDPDTVELDSLLSEYPTKRPHWCLRRHCYNKLPRWLLVLLLILALGFLLILLLLLLSYYVILPKVIEDSIRGSHLEFYSIALTQPNDTEYSLVLHATGAISNAGPIRATVHAFTVILHYKDQLLARMEMPRLEAGGSTVHFSISATMYIEDRAVFATFGQDMIHKDSLEWTLQGETTITVAGLDFSNVNYKTTVQIPGCSGLPDVQLVTFSMDRSNMTDIIVDLAVRMFNPSIISITPLGWLRFNILYKNSSLGTMFSVSEVNLTTGYNEVKMTGTLQPTNFTIFNELLDRYLTNKSSDVIAKGGNHSTSIKMYQHSLRDLTLQTVMKPFPVLLLKEIVFDYLQMEPVGNENVFLSSQLTAEISNPLGNSSLLKIEESSLQVELSYNNLTIGYLQTDPVTPSAQHGNFIQLTLLNQSLSFTPFTPNDINSVRTTGPGPVEENFAKFIREFIVAESVGLRFVGTTDVKAKTVITEVDVHGLLVDNLIHIRGLDNLRGVEILGFSVPKNGENGGVELNLNLTLYNPSPASVFLGDLTFNLFYQSAYMGYLNASQVSLIPGYNFLENVGLINPPEENLELAGQFFSNYFNGRNSTVLAVCAGVGNHEVAWLDEAAKSIELTTTLTGLPDDGRSLIGRIILNELETTFFSDGTILHNASLSTSFVNPFGIPIKILALAMSFEMHFMNKAMAQAVIPLLAVQSDAGGHINISYTSFPLQVMDFETFSQFGEALLLESQTSVDLVGHLLGSSVHTNFGVINITGLPLQQTIQLVGANQLVGAIKVVGASVIGAFANGLQLAFDLEVRNPMPNLAISAGWASLLFRKGDLILGNATIQKFDLGIGVSRLYGSGYYVDPKGNGYYIGRQFLSDYLKGRGSNLTFTDGISNIPVLQQALSKVRIEAELPGRSEGFIQNGFISGINLLALSVDVVLNISNPFDTILEADYVAFNISLSDNGIRIGQLAVDLLSGNHKPIIIAPGSSVITEALPVQVDGASGALRALWAILKGVGKTKVDVEGYFKALIGNVYRNTLGYAQKAIPTKLSL